ncbi:class F sortase [Micromonospora endolithica]|uniref:Class F sortase n=1 Tax=Micromonospora endolithica TaxID=230091 RepID=A0A3A9YVA2_9ACTN|nr:class F sortase [Micromonospora endolithica]RKN39689.1 class F sortase [Micromonospora endolithica]
MVGTGVTVLSSNPPRPSGAGTPGPARPGPAVPPLPRADPVAVSIPAIGVDAPLVAVGVDDRGTLEVPPVDKPTVAGWYRHGASPGETGNAVLVGHVDSAAGPAVFFDLGRLRPGDTVRVSRVDGRVASFVVESVASYPKDRFPTDEVYGPSTSAGLRVITCGGRFDRSSGNYVDNVVVFATRIP